MKGVDDEGEQLQSVGWVSMDCFESGEVATDHADGDDDAVFASDSQGFEQGDERRPGSVVRTSSQNR
jgi:hypothetical protein